MAAEGGGWRTVVGGGRCWWVADGGGWRRGVGVLRRGVSGGTARCDARSYRRALSPPRAQEGGACARRSAAASGASVASSDRRAAGCPAAQHGASGEAAGARANASRAARHGGAAEGRAAGARGGDGRSGCRRASGSGGTWWRRIVVGDQSCGCVQLIMSRCEFSHSSGTGFDARLFRLRRCRRDTWRGRRMQIDTTSTSSSCVCRVAESAPLFSNALFAGGVRALGPPPRACERVSWHRSPSR